MGHTCTALHYHIIFSTKNRVPSVMADIWTHFCWCCVALQLMGYPSRDRQGAIRPGIMHGWLGRGRQNPSPLRGSCVFAAIVPRACARG